MTTRATRSPRRRTVVALAVVLSVLAAFIIRLVDIQVVNAGEHVADSLNTGKIGLTNPLYGTRGSILDQNGTLLASSTKVYDAQLDPKLIMLLENDEENPPELTWSDAADRIAAITGQKGADVRELVAAAIEENPDTQFAQLDKGLTTEQYLELRDLGLPYLAMPSREVRVYPNGAVAGNIVGFLDGEGVGQAGVEKLASSCLEATDGEETYLRGKDGVVIPGSQSTNDPVDGGSVQLTINSDLNWYLQQMIAEETQKQKAKSGTALVVEVKTGKIRAAAEYPSLDPNDLEASGPNTWGNRVFGYTFEPGSTFKAVTAAAVLENSDVTPRTPVTASSREEFSNGAVVNDSFPHPTYTYTLAGALIDSSNVALSKYGTMVSPQVRHDYLTAFGVGEKTAVNFPGEEPGGIAPADTWDNQSLYTTTFGQAFTVTAPQVAGAYQAIANGGEKVDLSLIESCTQSDGTVVKAPESEREQIIQEKTADQISRMLENVAVQGGLADAIEVPGYRITSKTGTAQVAGKDGRYKQGVFFTSMVGFAPAEDPEYVVLVTLEEPTKVTSSAATASAFQKAMTQVLKTYRVMPSTQPMEDLLPKFD